MWKRRGHKATPGDGAQVAPAAPSVASASPRGVRVGDSVRYDGANGIVCDGPWPTTAGHKVRLAFPPMSDDGRTPTLDALVAELEPGPERPAYAVGDVVHYRGTLGRIVGEDEGGFIVAVTVPMAGGAAQTTRRERVPAWYLKIACTKHHEVETDAQ